MAYVRRASRCCLTGIGCLEYCLLHRYDNSCIFCPPGTAAAFSILSESRQGHVYHVMNFVSGTCIDDLQHEDTCGTLRFGTAVKLVQYFHQWSAAVASTADIQSIDCTCCFVMTVKISHDIWSNL